MKVTGIVRRIDDLGRVVIPKELRKTYQINEGDPLEIFVEDDQLILKKYEGNEPKCAVCGGYDNLHLVEGISICKGCALAVTDMVMEIGL